MSVQLSSITIIVRLIIATAISGVIGWDREHKNRPAGIRTHILVCLGACIVALIQKEIGFNALRVAAQYPQYKGVIRTDEARLIAQVVSGIGFLGAGTIIVEHHSIKGLTTAASLWVVACMGIAVGMGDYVIASASFVVVFGVVAFLKQIVRVSAVKSIEIEYRNKVATKKFILDYFQNKNIAISNVVFRANKIDGEYLYTNVYEVKLPRKSNYVTVIEDLSNHDDVIKVRAIAAG
ncbi:MgtC/SapB family protein [Companilactobacillus keshanensis]|uniref:MgtC/SapB family protein n=1 Tax=Companilactobacillus keshanensis TaxID=2486003 RepID=A0ABW4BYC2_9LACO|nr:MgtC/SapB family protein [Companilactobacillus keshanensis]